MRKEFNGHPSWNCWNVALWLSSDEAMLPRRSRGAAQHPHSEARDQRVLRDDRPRRLENPGRRRLQQDRHPAGSGRAGDQAAP